MMYARGLPGQSIGIIWRFSHMICTDLKNGSDELQMNDKRGLER